MFLEGEVNWILVLSVVAGASVLVALIASWFAITGTRRHATASDQLDLVQKVAAAADQRLFQILNAIPVALVETDLKGKFVFANRAAHQLLGRRDSELLGLRFHSATWGITYPDGRPIPPDLLPSARALRGQTVRGFQHVLANPSNRKKMLVSVTAMPIEDEWGRITGSTAALIETESLTTPEPMVIEHPVRSDDLTRRVFEAAASALVVVGGDGVVREANPIALALAGRSDGVVGGDFVDVFLADGERAEGRQVLRAAVSPNGTDREFIDSPDTGEAGVRWRLLPLTGDDGADPAVLLAGERLEPEAAPVAAPVEPEVAETAAGADPEAARIELLEAARREAENAAAEAGARVADLRAELDAARRLETVGRLTGGVAHDFNALLGVMTSALDMLLKQADDPSRVRRLGQAALTAGQRGEALTRRLTAFSQGEDAASPQALDVGVLLRGMESRLRAEAGPGIDLLIEGPSQPVDVRIDPVGFEGAVRALVRNAAEACGDGASIAVRLERLDAGGARLSVRDAGPGMTPEVAHRAAEPFFTTRPGQAGLGLAQVYAFARQSGGALELDSRPDEGTEAAVVLPGA